MPRANDCLTAPNVSSPRGQHWSYRIDRQTNRKCWYLHSTLGLLHRPAKPSDLHAASSTAGAPMSGSSADRAPRLRHIRKLVAKPRPAPLVSVITNKTVQQSDARSISQEFPLQGSTPQGDRSLPTNVIAAPGTRPEPATLGVAVTAAAVQMAADDTKPGQAETVAQPMADDGAVRPDENDAKPTAATVVGTVADADAVQPDPDSPNSDSGGLIAGWMIKSTLTVLANTLKIQLEFNRTAAQIGEAVKGGEVSLHDIKTITEDAQRIAADLDGFGKASAVVTETAEAAKPVEAANPVEAAKPLEVNKHIPGTLRNGPRSRGR